MSHNGIAVFVPVEHPQQTGNCCLPVDASKSTGSQCANPRTPVAELPHKHGLGQFRVRSTQHTSRLGTDFLVTVERQRNHRPHELHFMAGQLAESPDRVDSRHSSLTVLRNFDQCLGFATIDQLELSLLPNTPVCVVQKLDEFVHGDVAKALTHQASCFGNRRLFIRGSVSEAIKTSFAQAIPSVDPVTDEDVSVVVEVEIRPENFPNELVRIGQLVRRSFRRDGEGSNPAVCQAAAKITQKEVAVVSRGQPDTGVVRQSRRSIGEVGNRRNNVGRLALMTWMPQLLTIPRPPIGQVLVVHSSSNIGSLGDVDPASLITTVRVVIASEQVAEIVECQFLRISQPVSEFFQFRSIRPAAEDGSRVGSYKTRALLCFHVVTTVANAEVNSTVRTLNQPVHIVASKRDADSVSVMQRISLIGHSVTVFIAQLPEFWNARVIDVSTSREDASTGARLNAVESIGKDVRRVGPAVTIGIRQQTNSIVVNAVFVRLLAKMFTKHLDSLCHRLQLEVVQQPAHVIAIVLNALLLTECLGHVNATGFASSGSAANRLALIPSGN